MHPGLPLCCLGLLVLTGCSGVGSADAMEGRAARTQSHLCLILLPMTVYTDDPRLMDLPVAGQQSIHEGMVQAIMNRLELRCDADVPDCAAEPLLMFRHSGSVARPAHACGPGGGTVPQGYHYGQCLTDWGQRIVSLDPGICARRHEDEGGTGMAPMVVGLWVEAYRDRGVTVNPMLVDLSTHGTLEAETAASVPGHLVGGGAGRTRRELARVAGHGIADLLATALEP